MGKPHAQRQSEIIQSALALAGELGVQKVTTQAIADRVGIAQATVFRHFKSRDAIFRAVIEWLSSQLFDALQPCFSAQSSPPDERLNLLIERQLMLISRHRGMPRMLFSDRLHLESPMLKETVQKIIFSYLEQLTGLINEGIQSGHFKPDLDAQATARMVAALIQGTVMRWSLFDFNFKLEAQAGLLQTFVLNSVALPVASGNQS